MSRIGWWATHDYSRRSVEFSLPDWPGWEVFMELLDCAKAPYPEDSEKYATVIFETGCREAEAIKLRPGQFKWNEEAVVVKNAPLLKKGKTATRDITIKLDDKNPLGYELIEYVKEAKRRDYIYLLPGLQRFTREVEPWRHVSPKTVYNRITEIHPDLWPHALRGYRASMLVYERDFSVQDLVGWFDWEGADTALHYTKTRDMASAMGIKNVPR